MPGARTPAETLLLAAARARTVRRPVVLKLGGSAMEEPTATRGTLESIAVLHRLGVKLALVHGGGKPIDRAMAAAGLEPRKVMGRRYTDDATLKIVVRVLREINSKLEVDLYALGVSAAGYNDPDEKPFFPVRAARAELDGPDGTPIDLGHVGKPDSVWTDDLTRHLESGRLPVLPSLGLEPPEDEEDEYGGRWLNVNADTVAAAVAGALEAEACLFLTDSPGVLRDRRDPASLLPRLTMAECRELIGSGVIDGGMIPKVEACFEALAAGAGAAVILDGRNPHALLDWFLGEPAGTEIVS